MIAILGGAISVPVHSNYSKFKNHIPKEAHPEICRLAYKAVRGFVKDFISDDRICDENSLKLLFDAIFEVTGEDPDLRKLSQDAVSKRELRDDATPYENLIKNWGKRKSAYSAVAFYYFLHTHRHGVEIAEAIDKSTFFPKTFEERFGYLVPGGFREKETGSGQIRLNLALDPVAQSSFHFTKKTMDVLGRGSQKKILKEFLEGDPGFSWMQIAGGAGQGKSRLAHDLVLHADQELGWVTGFLDRKPRKEFMVHWGEWFPTRPTLIVVDYVIGSEGVLNAMIEALVSNGNRFNVRVRLLLVERQRFDRAFALRQKVVFDSDEQDFVASEIAEWFSKLCGDERRSIGDFMAFVNKRPVVELFELSDKSLCKIVKKIAPENIATSDKAIKKHLKRIDKTGSPLFAYFLGKAMGKNGENKTWTRHELLSETISRERAERWKTYLNDDPPHGYEDSPEMRMAVIATICRGTTFKKLALSGYEGAKSNASRRRALVLSDGFVGAENQEPASDLPPLEPDILGEYMVLSAVKDSIPAENIMLSAWNHNASETVSFLVRAVQNFSGHEALDEILAFWPATDTSRTVLMEGVSNILSAYWKAGHPPPLSVITVLERATDEKIPSAESSLGFCYLVGFGIAKEEQKGVGFLRRAAKSGQRIAKRNLGISYENGTGVPQNHVVAAKWYKKAADDGDASAMRLLGNRYSQGRGVRQDYATAAEWYYKAVEAGDIDALVSLGSSYEMGMGVEQDVAEANRLYERAAEAGNASAMRLLGNKYSQGRGVPQNNATAAKWYRKAVEAGDINALASLGIIYQNGKGVEQDLAEANRLYERAVKAGSATAMRLLGNNYLQGHGVPQNKATAAKWCRKAVKAGDAEAQSLLVQLYFLIGDQNDATGQETTLGVVLNTEEENQFAAPDIGLLWSPVEGEETNSLLSKISRTIALDGLTEVVSGKTVVGMQKADTPFYPGLLLVDIALRPKDSEDIEFFSALVHQDAAMLLDGTSPRIHLINPKFLSIESAENQEAYLRFFCEFVRGDKGPFHIVTTVDDLMWAEAPEPEMLEHLGSVIAKPKLVSRDTGVQTTIWTACVRYAGKLFNAQFSIHETGTVVMSDDSPIAKKLPIEAPKYNGIIRKLVFPSRKKSPR